MTHIELPLCAFIAATLVLVPFPWHWRARNVPTLSIIVWLSASNIIYGVNAIIWANNVDIVVPVWCDITSKLQIGATMALPACCLCLCITLERISSVRQVSSSLKEKRNRMLFDGVMCWGLPIIYMALHYIVQGHRYDIVENLGCRPAIYNSVQSILLVWMPPLVVVVLTLIFATLALHHFLQRRITFARHLQDSNSALTTSRYFRLMAMAIVQMVWTSVVIAVNMWFTVRTGLRPWISWEDVHSNFSRVGLFPAILIPSRVLQVTYFLWWTIPISSLLFFIFFAFGQDAINEYKALFNWIARVIFRRNPNTSAKSIYISAPMVHQIALSKKPSSTASSDTIHGRSDFKAPSSELSSQPKKILTDESSSIYAPNTVTIDIPSPSWSESFSDVASRQYQTIPKPHNVNFPRHECA